MSKSKSGAKGGIAALDQSPSHLLHRALQRALDIYAEEFGEAPPSRADGPAMIEAIMKSLPDRSYERLVSPHLRPSQIKGPRDGRAN